MNRNLIFSFASIVSSQRYAKDGPRFMTSYDPSKSIENYVSIDGMKTLAQTVHKHGAKITWLIDYIAAEQTSELINQWHKDYGDDVALSPIKLASDEEKICSQLLEQREIMKKLFPWSAIDILSGCHTNQKIVKHAYKLGFKGMWGFCPEQITIDDITDRGCPWGSYYINPENRLLPSSGRGLVSIEWTARDFLKSFYTGYPSMYSFDVNDVARSSLCTASNINYWLELYNDFLKNATFNRYTFFAMHQESHEMENNEISQCYTKEDIAESLIIIDKFLEHAKNSARFVTLSEYAAIYHESYTHTMPFYFVAEDLKTPPHNFNSTYAWNISRGPWPKTFFYNDTECSLVFEHGKVSPSYMRCYTAGDTSLGPYYEHTYKPLPKRISDTTSPWKRIIELEIESEKAMPYALTIWEDLRFYQIGNPQEFIDAKIIPGELAFVRFALAPGLNKIKIVLNGK